MLLTNRLGQIAFGQFDMSTIRNITFSLVAVIFAKNVGFMQSFVVAKSLGPAAFGVWITLLLVASYSPIVCLGTVEAMVKEVPFYLGRNDLLRVREIENGVLGSIILAASAFVATGLLGFVVLPSDFLGAGPVLLLLVFLTIAISAFNGFFYWRLTAYESFRAVASLDICRSSLAFVFIGGLGWLWGLPGAVVGYLLHEVGVCVGGVWLNVRHHGRPGVDFRPELLWHAVRVGFPITVLWWVLILQTSVDRVVLGSLVGASAVGYFGLGLSLASVLGLLPGVVGRVLYPMVSRQFGKEADPHSMKALVLAPTLALAALLVNLQLLLLVFLPILYNTLLPKYQPGLDVGQILILGSFFGCLFRNGANYLVATHKERIFLEYILLTLLFNVVADVAFVKAGWGLEGVALGTSLAGLLLNTLVWRRVLLGLGGAHSEVWPKLLGLYLPLLILAAAVFGLRLVYGDFLRKFDAASIGLSIGLFILVNGLLYYCPLYRSEFPGWRRVLLKAARPVWKTMPIPHAVP